MTCYKVKFMIFMLLFLALLNSSARIITSSSTDSFLECRANLSRSIKNETIFRKKVQLADYVFTGKIKDFRVRHMTVKVKRAIKGLLNATIGLDLNDTCAVYIRQSYTGIFMGKISADNTGIFMSFGPVPLTLANLDRTTAAVKGWYFYEISNLYY